MPRRARTLLAVSLAASTLACASVPMAAKDRDEAAKSFRTSPDKANLYIYRASKMGPAVKFPVTLDGKMLGELPGGTFVLATVPPGPHTVYVSAENSKAQVVQAEAGKNQYVKVSPAMGWMSARVGLELVTEDREAQPEIVECRLIEGIQ